MEQQLINGRVRRCVTATEFLNYVQAPRCSPPYILYMDGHRLYIADENNAQRVFPLKNRIPKKLAEFIKDDVLVMLVCDLYEFVMWNVALGWGGRMYGEFGKFAELHKQLNKKAMELGIIEEGPRTS